MKSQLSENILKKIKQENLKPKPRWYFMVLNTLTWLLFVGGVLLGGVTLAIILNIYSDEWYLHNFSNLNYLVLLISTFPYLWLLFFLGCFVLSYYYLQRTKDGYKINSFMILLFTLATTLLLCIVFVFLKIGQSTDRALNNNFLYHQLTIDREKHWHCPDKGIVVGYVVHKNTHELLIQDLQGTKWLAKDCDTNIINDPKLRVNQGVMIKVFGNNFEYGDFNQFCVSRVKIMGYKRFNK